MGCCCCCYWSNRGVTAGDEMCCFGRLYRMRPMPRWRWHSCYVDGVDILHLLDHPYHRHRRFEYLRKHHLRNVSTLDLYVLISWYLDERSIMTKEWILHDDGQQGDESALGGMFTWGIDLACHSREMFCGIYIKGVWKSLCQNLSAHGHWVSMYACQWSEKQAEKEGWIITQLRDQWIEIEDKKYPLCVRIDLERWKRCQDGLQDQAIDAH